jgi:TolA-binding protein
MSEVTPPAGETGTPKAPENVTPTQAPTQGNAGDAAVEQLRREKEQAEMRANQLANQLRTKEEAEATAKAKELEEQNQFRELYEQEKAKNEGFVSEREAEENRKELEKAKSGVLSDYSDDVKSLAEDTGVTLDSTDEAQVAAYKGKLEKIKASLGGISKVGPNNPGKPSSLPEMSQDELRVSLKDPAKFAEIVGKRKGIAAMMSPRPS